MISIISCNDKILRRVSPLRNYILPNFTFILYSILDTLSIKLPYSLSKKVQKSRNYWYSFFILLLLYFIISQNNSQRRQLCQEQVITFLKGKMDDGKGGLSNVIKDGKAKYGYVYAKTYKETKLKLQTAIQSKNQPSSKEPVKYSIWLEHWLKLSRLRVKESSFIKYKNSIEKHIKPALGHLLMSEISTSKVETFIDMKLGELSPKSVSELLIIIKDSIRSANAEGDTSPCQLDRLAIKYHPSEMRD